MITVRTRSTARGMSLLEIMVAASILVVALFGLVGALGGGQALTSQSRERSQAALQAASELERISALSWDDLGLLIATPQAPKDVTIQAREGGSTFNLTPVAGETKTLFVTVADTAHTDLRQVRVRVRWQSAGKPTELNVYSLIARH